MTQNTVVVKLSGKALGGVEELSKLFQAARISERNLEISNS